MDDFSKYNTLNENENPQQASEEVELSHTDKLVGVLSEPSATYAQTAKFPPRTIDWLLPVILVIVLSIVSNFFLMKVPSIKYQVQQKQMKQIEKSLDEQVAKGTITRAEADARIDQTRNFMSSGSSGIFMVIQAVSIIFMVFIMFFIVSLVCYIIAKVGLKGEGTYSSAMVGYGLSFYIAALGSIVMTIASVVMGKLITGTNLAAYMDMDKTTLAGFLLGKIDVFSIWALVVVAIGLSKMFHSNDTKKYIIAVFTVWVVWSLLFFALAQAVPFFKSWLEFI